MRPDRRKRMGAVMADEFNPMDISGHDPSVAAAERKRRAPAKETPVENVAAKQLRTFVERIERLEEEKKEVADFIKDVYGEAKAMGFNTKILKKVVALRRKDEAERMEEDAILDTYLAALGMIPDA